MRIGFRGDEKTTLIKRFEADTTEFALKYLNEHIDELRANINAIDKTNRELTSKEKRLGDINIPTSANTISNATLKFKEDKLSNDKHNYSNGLKWRYK